MMYQNCWRSWQGHSICARTSYVLRRQGMQYQPRYHRQFRQRTTSAESRLRLTDWLKDKLELYHLVPVAIEPQSKCKYVISFSVRILSASEVMEIQQQEIKYCGGSSTSCHKGISRRISSFPSTLGCCGILDGRSQTTGVSHHAIRKIRNSQEFKIQSNGGTSTF